MDLMIAIFGEPDAVLMGRAQITSKRVDGFYFPGSPKEKHAYNAYRS